MPFTEPLGSSETIYANILSWLKWMLFLAYKLKIKYFKRHKVDCFIYYKLLWIFFMSEDFKFVAPEKIVMSNGETALQSTALI